MGKNLIQQKRGKGSPTYRSPSFRYLGASKLTSIKNAESKGEVTDLVSSSGHNGPMMQVKYENGDVGLLYAPESIKVGDKIEVGEDIEIKPGNILPLKNIPEGTPIYNIESKPGDGGKFVRSSGVFAKIVSKFENKISIQLPSSKNRDFSPECRAIVGVISGGGKTEKPFLKAGTMYHKMKARNKLYPSVSGTSMNAVDHPFGGSESAHKGKPTQAPRNASPGRKVGKIAPKRTGRKKR